MRCLFAKGKSGETNLSDAIPMGSFILPVVNASTHFQTGDLFFITDQDGANAEFLGPVTSVSENEVQCVLAVSQSREAGDVCFKPLSFFWLPRKRTHPIRRVLDTGVEQRRSAGGVLYLTKIRETSLSQTASFDNLRKKEFDELLSFIDTVLLGGLERFTFCDEDGVVMSAALFSSNVSGKEKSPEMISIELEILEIEKSRSV